MGHSSVPANFLRNEALQFLDYASLSNSSIPASSVPLASLGDKPI